MYYQRHEVQRRMTIFFSGSIIAGALSGVSAILLSNTFAKRMLALCLRNCKYEGRRKLWGLEVDIYNRRNRNSHYWSYILLLYP
jgi:hypothetical protein